MAPRLTFRHRQRLSRQRDFERVLARRCSRRDRLLVVYADRNGLAWSRLAIRTGRKVGGAVQRNRVRRRLREAFRHHQHALPVGLDLICIVVGSSAVGASSAELTRSLTRLIAQAAERLDKA